MNPLRQAAQQALESLEGCVKALDALHAPGDSIYTRASDLADRAEIALRDALAQQTQTPCDIAEDGVCEVIDCCRNPTQQEQEPVARVIDDETPEGSTEWIPYSGRQVPVKTGDLLYTRPHRREWQSLSEDELTALGVIHSRYQEESLETGGWFDFARAIETKLKEKNHD